MSFVDGVGWRGGGSVGTSLTYSSLSMYQHVSFDPVHVAVSLSCHVYSCTIGLPLSLLYFGVGMCSGCGRGGGLLFCLILCSKRVYWRWYSLISLLLDNFLISGVYSYSHRYMACLVLSYSSIILD